jgi:hypothetical protein
MIEITSAKQISDYKIEIIFNDKTKGIVDLKNTIFTDPRKIFKELKDLNKFKKFKIEFDTLSWENGLDLAPEFLYNLLLNSDKLIEIK